jgi:hypothetical protein
MMKPLETPRCESTSGKDLVQPRRTLALVPVKRGSELTPSIYHAFDRKSIIHSLLAAVDPASVESGERHFTGTEK